MGKSEREEKVKRALDMVEMGALAGVVLRSCQAASNSVSLWRVLWCLNLNWF